jgi:DNA-binding NarL/FixJ family response regulator
VTAHQDAALRITTVLVVDDDPAAVAEARAALAIVPDVQLLAVGTLAEARLLLRRHRIDMAIVDLGLPDGSGLTLVAELTADAVADHARGMLCVVRTVFDDDDRVLRALSAGAHGYLIKGESVALTRERIQALMRGEPVVSPTIARRVLAEFVDAARRTPPGDDTNTLTARERDVLQQVAVGYTVAEVARALAVADNTVKTHLKAIYAKLGVRSRVRALNVARDRGLIDPPRGS